MKGISLELYKVFWEIGKAKNITRAAENLYVSQPNISATLKALENQLHATLCIRTKKGITLTHEGDVLFNELDKAFSYIQLAETKIEKLVHLESGTISISASDTICNYYLLPYITSFTKAHPGIRLEITNRTSLETVELLKKGQVDIGFINLPLEDASLTTTLCSEVHDVLIGGSMYKGLSQTEISISELSQYPLVMLEQKSNSRLCLDRYFEENRISLSPVLELGSLDLVISFVKNNMGLAFIPMELCGRFIDNHEIFHIGLKNPLPVRGIGLIELSGTAHSCAVIQFKKLYLNPVHRYNSCVYGDSFSSEVQSMRLLFELDTKDYDIYGKAFVRPSVRGVIIRDGKVAMVHSMKFDYYKFPGGGIENGESNIDALIREIAEETGLSVIPGTINEYGYVHRIQKGQKEAVFIQDNYYYLCETAAEFCPQHLDDYEAEECFTLEFVAPMQAIITNREKDHGPKDQLMLEREARVLDNLIREGYFRLN